MSFAIRIVDKMEDRYQLFRQRHTAYVAEGAIDKCSDIHFSDNFDMQDTSILIACWFNERLVGSIRFSVEPPNTDAFNLAPSCPEFMIFRQELSQIKSLRTPISSGSRFAVERCFDQRQKAALFIMIAQVRAANAVGAKWGVATARGAHLAFYRRFMLMEPISKARRMPSLNYEYTLLASNLEKNYNTSLRRFSGSIMDEFAEKNPDWDYEIRQQALCIPGSHEWLF
jgi:N-acyl-L-homoserine lactone synthetase